LQQECESILDCAPHVRAISRQHCRSAGVSCASGAMQAIAAGAIIASSKNPAAIRRSKGTIQFNSQKLFFNLVRRL
jgi:hypothetical protein